MRSSIVPAVGAENTFTNIRIADAMAPPNVLFKEEAGGRKQEAGLITAFCLLLTLFLSVAKRSLSLLIKTLNLKSV
jgi:hypothetical protein